MRLLAALAREVYQRIKRSIIHFISILLCTKNINEMPEVYPLIACLTLVKYCDRLLHLPQKCARRPFFFEQHFMMNCLSTQLTNSFSFGKSNNVESHIHVCINDPIEILI